MLLVPITNKISWRNPPIVTIGIILLNTFIYFAFQYHDNQRYHEAIDFYFESGLAQIELPYYADQMSGEPVEILIDGDQVKPDEETVFGLYTDMRNDTAFMERLRNDEIITPDEPDYAKWKELRLEYEANLSKVTFYTWGLRPAIHAPLTFLTHMFLHGSVGHLVGNMIFLWIVGCILEMGCGRFLYTGIYLLGGLAAVCFFWLLNMKSGTPLVGASGAIAGLMGTFTILYGKEKVKVFLSLGFYFIYKKMPGIALLPFWIGNEIYQLFFGGASSVAYTAHIGGLIGGSILAFLVLRFTNLVNRDIFEDLEEDKVSPLMDKAMACMESLDMEKGRSYLIRALEEDPKHTEAMTHLFNIDKLSPESRNFHETASMLITALMDQQVSQDRVLSIFNDYRSLTKQPRLSPGLYIRISMVLAAGGEIQAAARIVSALVKKKPDTPGIPSALLKLSNACREKGLTKQFHMYRKAISARYPESAEANLIQQARQKKGPV